MNNMVCIRRRYAQAVYVTDNDGIVDGAEVVTVVDHTATANKLSWHMIRVEYMTRVRRNHNESMWSNNFVFFSDK
jgi:hypothetical protein